MKEFRDDEKRSRGMWVDPENLSYGLFDDPVEDRIESEEDQRRIERREFLKRAAALGLAVTGLVLLKPVRFMRGTAWAESKIPEEYWKAASKFGEPQGKFGKPGEPVKITIGYQPYCLQCMTANINRTAKLWEKYLPKGSQVQWFRTLSGPLINNNMLAGKNQFGYMCDTPGLRAMDTVPVITGQSGGYDTGEHGAVVIRRDLWESKKVKSVKDMEGMKIGTPYGSFSHRQALDVIRQNGIRVKLLDQSTELSVTHMRSKNIEANVTWEPYPSYLEYLGIGYRILTGLDHECTCIAYRPQNKWHNWTTSCTTLMHQDWLRDRPDVMVAFLKAEEEARDMWYHDIDLASYYVWRDIPEFPQPVVRMTMEMNVPDGRQTQNLKDHLKGIARQWRDLDMLTTPKSADPDEFIEKNVDDTFLKIAYREFKEEGKWTGDALPGFHEKIFEAQKKKHDLKDYMNVTLKEKPWKPTAYKWT